MHHESDVMMNTRSVSKKAIKIFLSFLKFCKLPKKATRNGSFTTKIFSFVPMSMKVFLLFHFPTASVLLTYSNERKCTLLCFVVLHCTAPVPVPLPVLVPTPVPLLVLVPVYQCCFLFVFFFVSSSLFTYVYVIC